MENKKVACKKCIEAYRLSQEVQGEHLDKCYWCCSKIFLFQDLRGGVK